MTLRLYFHPLSSFCHKALVALYENDTPFTPAVVDLGNEASAAAMTALWPMKRFPLLQDEARGETLPESSVIIEYLQLHYPGATRFLPADPALALEARLWDRVFDNYLQVPMQKVVFDSLRPEGGKDALGVDQARQQLALAYDLLERRLAGRQWVVGEDFGLADCAAAPALFYANTLQPFAAGQVNLRRYLRRLEQRPAYARVLAEAKPFFRYFPLEPKPRIGASA